jgi:transcriptional regulator with XRE-family HTH domain
MEEEEKKYLIALGDVIFARRKVLRLTQTQFAEKVGLTKTHISRIERGHVATTIIVLRRIAKELNIDIIQLLESVY